MSNASNIFDELLGLHKAYAFTYRGITTEERYKNLIESKLIASFTFDSNFLREPLIEHIGHLPIIAAYLHQKIEHSGEIDLGRALTMLAIHDLGETVTGDKITFHKEAKDDREEHQIIKDMLPPYLFNFFEEFEERVTLDAKFAKAVDSLAPELHELAIPEITIKRFKHFDFNTDKIIAKKRAHFEWDKVLSDIFEYMIEQYRKLEKDCN